jgi:hypothetical protein
MDLLFFGGKPEKRGLLALSGTAIALGRAWYNMGLSTK